MFWNKDNTKEKTNQCMYLVFLYGESSHPLLPAIAKHSSPNMAYAILFCFAYFYLSYLQKFSIVALLIQIYLFLDILDGNLARYKNMKSALGAKLDSINDKTFYTLLFVFIGYKTVPLSLIFGVVLLINLYGIIATYYIVPRLRKLTRVERRGLKKYFMDRGFIIGMDLGTIDILTTVLRESDQTTICSFDLG